MAKGSTSNYTRIQELAIASAERVQDAGKSDMLEFPKLHQRWHWLELKCAHYGYDIFAAWSEETRAFCHQLRDQLLWLNWYALPEPASINETFGLAGEDVNILMMKGRTYGDSWKKRSGVGAYMMLARKYDRIENIVQSSSGSSAEQLMTQNIGDVLDDIADLRRYLLLVEDEMLNRETVMVDTSEPTAHGYVDQDR